MPVSPSFQQAAQPELHDNPDTSVVWVKVAIVTKATGRYNFMVLRQFVPRAATEEGRFWGMAQSEDLLPVFALTRLP